MKVISSIQGLAGVRVSIEEVVPQPPTPSLIDIVEGIGTHFKFAVKPAPQSVGTGVPLAFGGGKVRLGDQDIFIQQLYVLADGDIVSASNTQEAKIGLDALIEYLNKEFRYRMEGTSAKRYYVSNIVVEFDVLIAKQVGGIGVIQELLAQRLPFDEPFRFFRLAYTRGFSNMPSPQFANLLDGVERSDFVIERRAGYPLTSNRFFCSAPCHTEEHVRILEEIERALG